MSNLKYFKDGWEEQQRRDVVVLRVLSICIYWGRAKLLLNSLMVLQRSLTSSMLYDSLALHWSDVLSCRP